MKIGDEVVCKYPFEILKYHADKHMFQISLLNPKRPHTVIDDDVFIHQYVTALSLLPEAVDYCMPGPRNPYNCEDYYPIADPKKCDKTVKFGLFYYQIILDPNFYYNGKYTLQSIGTDANLHRKATKKTPEHRAAIINKLIGQQFEHTDLSGVIIDFIEDLTLIRDLWSGIEFSFPTKYLMVYDNYPRTPVE